MEFSPFRNSRRFVISDLRVAYQSRVCLKFGGWLAWIQETHERREQVVHQPQQMAETMSDLDDSDSHEKVRRLPILCTEL